MSKPTASKTALTDSEIRQYIIKAQAGDLDAREKAFYAFLPLAYNRAERFSEYGVPIEDLRQEACYGLLLALDRYDAYRPETFSTFARHYIDKYARKAVQEQNTYIPGCYKEDFYLEIKKFIAEREKFKEEQGREPSEQELSELLQFSTFRIRRLKAASETFLKSGLEYDPALSEQASDDFSLRPLEDMLMKSDSPLDFLETNVLLSSREKEVLKRRLGFNDSGKPESFPRISAEMGLSQNTLKLAYSAAISKIQESLGVAG